MAMDQSMPTVAMCRGCCCGTTKKHPGIDHDANEATLRRLLEGVANLRVTDCLGPCERSNVLVVSPSRSGRSRGGRPTWLGFVLETATNGEISVWLRSGGPGLARLPRSLSRHHFAGPGQRSPQSE